MSNFYKINKDTFNRDFERLLEKETNVNAYLDLANMFHWQDVLKWNFSVDNLIDQLKQIKAVKEIRIYFGTDIKNRQKSENFFKRIRSKGAFVITKDVKYIKKEINENFFIKRKTSSLLNKKSYSKLIELQNAVKEQGLLIVEEPKCNFDVEISLDMLDASDKVSGYFLFSGDSDFKETLVRLKIKKKNIYIFGVRGQVGYELWPLMTKYIDFGKWYKGYKMRKPHPSGAA